MDLKQAHRLACELMEEHRLFTYGWSFVWLRSKRLFGYCDYKNKTIGLSAKLTLLNTESEVRDTILHEIAHYLTPKHGHDKVWKQKCLQIGGNGLRLYSDKTVIVPPHRFKAHCSVHNINFLRYRKPSRNSYCNKCWNKDWYRDIVPLLPLKWEVIENKSLTTKQTSGILN